MPSSKNQEDDSMKSNITPLITITTIITLILSMGIIAQIQATPTSGPTPLIINFSSDENSSSYAWDFNNDQTIDSTQATPTYTFNESGEFLITLQTQNNTYNTTIIVTASSQNTQPKTNQPSSQTNVPPQTAQTELNLAATASQEKGNAPLAVQFTAITTATSATYAWDFEGDGKIDSTTQNPTYTYDKTGEFNATLTVTNNQQTATKTIPIIVTQFNSNLALISYFPKTVKLGENHITFIIQNNGSDTIANIGSKVVAQGLQYASSSSIEELRSQDQDSVTAVVNVIQSEGTITGIVKIVDKTFPVTFNVTAQTTYNKDEIIARLNATKTLLATQEKIYTEKKSQGFLVQEVYDSIKSAKNRVQETEQQILTDKLQDADINLNLLQSSITDIRENLQDAVKQEVTALSWVKDNAVAIAAVIAALGTISGFAIKASKSVKTGATKLTETVKQKVSKDTKPSDTKTQPATESPTDTDKKA